MNISLALSRKGSGLFPASVAPSCRLRATLIARLARKHPHQASCRQRRHRTTASKDQTSAESIARASFARAGPRLSSSSSPSGPSPKRRRLLFYASLAAGAFLIYRRADSLLGLSSPPRLNTETFTPYTIISKQAVSPTLFSLTCRPSLNSPSDEQASSDIHAQAWRLGLWSVEAKQPEMQVSREYTPLPPRYGFHGDLSLLVRRVDGGAVSSYLARRELGDTLELRGPTQTFDLPGCNSVGRVVFLAGGTGIAPAMQVVANLLGREEVSEGDRPEVTVLWANRRWEDVRRDVPAVEAEQRSSWSWPWPWQGRTASAKPMPLAQVKEPTPIAEHLQDLQRRYGTRLRVELATDEADVFIGERDVLDAMGIPSGSSAAVEPDAEQPQNLLFVSGPDGFVAHYAGAKRWGHGGKEVQGPLGGVLGRIRDRLAMRTAAAAAADSGEVGAHRHTVFSANGESWMAVKL